MKKTEDFLSGRYEFYLNVFSGKTCYKRLNAENDTFQPITDYDFNSLYRELKNEDISVNKEDLKSILHSAFIRRVNPFIQFLETIEPCNNETDYITKIASSVTTKNDDYFQWVFKKWFVGVVACVVGSGVANETVLILLGKQAIGKTRWLESLVPHELAEYYYSGEINPQNKDHLALFSSKIIINLDELTSFSPSRVESFKSLLSAKKVTYRRPHGTYNEDYPRIASVVGTSNHKDVLMDTSGNRRYLCIDAFELKSIDKEELKKAYKQAYQLYQDGFKYYFEDTDIAEVNAVNLDYMQANEGTDIINKYFEVCETDHPSAMFMNATEVLDFLGTTYQENTKLGVQKVGRLLNDFGFKDKKSNGIKRYALLLKHNGEETQAQTFEQEQQNEESNLEVSNTTENEKLLRRLTTPIYSKYLQVKN